MHIVGRLALTQAGAEFVRLGAQLLVAERGETLVESLHGVGDGIDFFQFSVGIAAEDLI